MATVVIITQECVEIVHHEGGPNSTYIGKAPTEKESVAAIKRIIKQMNTNKAIADVMVKAEAGKGLRKLKASLADKKLSGRGKVVLASPIA